MVVKEGLKGEVMIVGSPNEITILELAQPVKKLTESKSKRVPPPETRRFKAKS
jgi:nucleoside-diphosphate-sugar epimerase